MKTYNFKHILPLSIAIFCNISVLISQVGINTTNPRATLEVAGDVKISGDINIALLSSLNNGDVSTFLTQDVDDSVKTLDVNNPTGAALAYIQEYVVDNIYEDWISDFNTGIDATDYVLIAVSAIFNTELALDNAYNLSDNYSLPITDTFISGGTWHLRSNYPVARKKDSSIMGSWTITTLIFSKDLSKQFGTINIDMANTTTGSASTPIID